MSFTYADAVAMFQHKYPNAMRQPSSSLSHTRKYETCDHIDWELNDEHGNIAAVSRERGVRRHRTFDPTERRPVPLNTVIV